MFDCCILHSILNFSIGYLKPLIFYLQSNDKYISRVVCYPSMVDSIYNPNCLYNKTPNRSDLLPPHAWVPLEQTKFRTAVVAFYSDPFPSFDENSPTVNVSAKTIKARVVASFILPPSPLISGKFSTQLASFTTSSLKRMGTSGTYGATSGCWRKQWRLREVLGAYHDYNSCNFEGNNDGWAAQAPIM